MNYLFFDIECSNCFEGIYKVCEYGAILVNENFQILKRYDFQICPGSRGWARFDTSIYKRDPEFNWAYDFDYYFNCPRFPYFYKQIKDAMEDDETIIIGYAVKNDIGYLNSVCEQYKLRPITFKAFDLKLIKDLYKKEKQKVRGLKGAFIDLCGEDKLKDIIPHLSMDDAKMTMMIFRQICSNLDMKPNELLSLCDNCVFNSELKKPVINEETEFRNTCKKTKNECQVLWGNFYRKYLNHLEDEKCIGKLVSISSKLKSNVDIITDTINGIKDNGFIPYNFINGSDYLIVLDEDDKERLLSKFKYTYKGNIITLADLQRGGA